MGTAIEKYREKLAAKAQETVREERVGGSFLSTAGGILKEGENEFPGNQCLVVIAAHVREHTYYDTAYAPDSNLPPRCFALGTSAADMEAHENIPEDDEDSYFEMQSETGLCKDCDMFKWGSSPRGKGKACAERRRLALIPAGQFTWNKKERDYDIEVFDEPEHYSEADAVFLKVPPTSLRNWSKYVNMLQREHQMPPFGVLTRIYIEPDPKTQFQVCFELLEVIEDDDILGTLFDRNEEAEQSLMEPYDEPSEDDLEQPTARAQNGIRGLKKKRR